MKLLFVGDLFLGGDLSGKKADIRSETFWNADKKYANLEHPISDAKACADKCTLFAGSSTIGTLKDLHITAVNLANNHIQDKLDCGISDTLYALDHAGVGHFGVGADRLKAASPFSSDEKIQIFGYCEFGKPYLKKIQVSTNTGFGVNPLRLGQIHRDLDSLEPGTKAILFFHWGREHVWLPPWDDVQLAKTLLEDERVLLIIGTHSHRAQGYIRHNDKFAFFSLGNFLFPNFFIEPPTQIASTDTVPTSVPVTRYYHPVFALTYKKWLLRSRISLMIEYDTSTGKFFQIPVIQEDNAPTVRELQWFQRKLVNGWILGLSKLMKVPSPVYRCLSEGNAILSLIFGRMHIVFFCIRQIGILNTFEFIKTMRRAK